LRELIAEVRSHRAVLLATHILQDVEILCEEVVVLREGRLVTREQLHEQRLARIHLLRPPAIENLGKLPGVTAVREQKEGWFELKFDQEPEALAQQIALRNWGLAAFVPRHHDTESLVSSLVGIDDEAA